MPVAYGLDSRSLALESVSVVSGPGVARRLRRVVISNSRTHRIQDIRWNGAERLGVPKRSIILDDVEIPGRYPAARLTIDVRLQMDKDVFSDVVIAPKKGHNILKLIPVIMECKQRMVVNGSAGSNLMIRMEEGFQLWM
jgi:hypothetical protein